MIIYAGPCFGKTFIVNKFPNRAIDMDSVFYQVVGINGRVSESNTLQIDQVVKEVYHIMSQALASYYKDVAVFASIGPCKPITDLSKDEVILGIPSKKDLEANAQRRKASGDEGAYSLEKLSTLQSTIESDVNKMADKRFIVMDQGELISFLNKRRSDGSLVTIHMRDALLIAKDSLKSKTDLLDILRKEV